MHCVLQLIRPVVPSPPLTSKVMRWSALAAEYRRYPEQALAYMLRTQTCSVSSVLRRSPGACDRGPVHAGSSCIGWQCSIDALTHAPPAVGIGAAARAAELMQVAPRVPSPNGSSVRFTCLAC